MKLRYVALAALLLLGVPAAWSADIADTVILVAKRNLQDRVYGKTILVARPLGEERHIGFIVNRPTSMTLGKLFPKHAPSQKVIGPVYLGGPVGLDVIFALVEAQASPGAHSLPFTQGLYLAYDSEVVDRIIETQAPQARFFAGMVLWRPHELAEELKRGLWYVLDPQPEILLRKSTDGLWEELVGRSERRANMI